jgi:L-arabinose isomerase
MAYAPSGDAREALCRTRLPLAVISTSRDPALPVDLTGEHLRANQAMHGVQDLANVLRRAGRRFILLAGHFSHARFRDRLDALVRAAAGARVLRRGTVGRIGRPFAGMLDFAFDPTALSATLGLKLRELEQSELARRAGEVDDDRIADFLSWANETFRIDPELKAEQLAAAARWSLALEDLAAQHELNAVAFNFQFLMDTPEATLPFIGADRLMARGVGYAGEGDVLTAALNAAIARIAGEASFTEMFCPDYERGEVLLSHMGECNLAMADPERPVVLKSNPFKIGRCVPPAVPVFQFTPGPATLVSLSEAPGAESRQSPGFQLLACRAEVVRSPEHARLTSPYARVRFDADLPDFLERFSRAGGTHHLVIAYGDRVQELEYLAESCGLTFLQLPV